VIAAAAIHRFGHSAVVHTRGRWQALRAGQEGGPRRPRLNRWPTSRVARDDLAAILRLLLRYPYDSAAFCPVIGPKAGVPQCGWRWRATSSTW